MTYILLFLNISLLLSFCYWMYRKWNPPKKFFCISLTYRICMGLAMGLIYTYYYPPNDTWSYFHDAEKLSALAREDFSSYLKALFDDASNLSTYVIIDYKEWRSIFFIKIVSALCLASDDNYWVCSAYFSLVSFACSWYLHRTICKWKASAEFVSAFSLIFFPSIAFWASGVEKESLAFSGLCILLAGILRYQIGEKIYLIHWMLIGIAFFILLKLRYFWLAVFVISYIPALIFIYLSKRNIKRVVIIGSMAVILILIVISLSFIHPILSSSRILGNIVFNHNKLIRVSSYENIIHFHHLTPDWGSMMVNSPLALFSGLFRPFVWEARGILGLFASFENIFLLLMTVFSIPRIKKALRSSSSPLLISTIAYIVLMCIFLALSTPNFGSLSRYRIGFLPLFIFIICYKNPLMLRFQQIFRAKES